MKRVVDSTLPCFIPFVRLKVLEILLPILMEKVGFSYVEKMALKRFALMFVLHREFQREFLCTLLKALDRSKFRACTRFF